MLSEERFRRCIVEVVCLAQALESCDLARVREVQQRLESLLAGRSASDLPSDWAETLDALDGLVEGIGISLSAFGGASAAEAERLTAFAPLLRHLSRRSVAAAH